MIDFIEREVGFDPDVSVALGDLKVPADFVVLAGSKSDDQPRRDPLGSQHQSQGAGEVLAVTSFFIE